MRQVAGERGVNSPTGTSPSFDAGWGKEEEEGWGEKSETYVIYSGECYVGGPDYKWNKSISETTNHDWYYYKENYNESVCSYNYIVNLVVP